MCSENPPQPIMPFSYKSADFHTDSSFQACHCLSVRVAAGP